MVCGEHGGCCGRERGGILGDWQEDIVGGVGDSFGLGW